MKKSFYLIVFVCLGVFARATHNRAGEILYKRIAPFTAVVGSSTVEVYTFSITVIKYCNTGPNIADRCLDTVYFGDGSLGLAPRLNGPTGCCGTLLGNPIGCGDVILNMPGYVVTENIYSVVHVFAGPGNYYLRSKDPNRNTGIVNIPNSDNYQFCITSLLVIKASMGANSSPILTIPPVDQGALNACFLHNPGATDADGDSLSFELVNCECAPTYSVPAFGAGGSFSIHPVQGTLSWCSPQQMGEYNTAILIREWRKNQSGIYEMMGYVTRDMQILVNSVYTGLSEQQVNSGLMISPNPSHDLLRINVGASKELTELRIYDLNGQQLYSERLQNENENAVDVSNFQAGFYLLELKNNEGVQVRKFLKN